MDPLSSTDDHLNHMHKDVLYWRAVLFYFEDDLAFIEKLLKAPILVGDIKKPNAELDWVVQKTFGMKMSLKDFGDHLLEHENEMREIWECDDISCDDLFQKRHDETEQRFWEFSKKFHMARKEIFLYFEQRLELF